MIERLLRHLMRKSVLIGALWAVTALYVWAQGGVGPIGNLMGRVDSNNALLVSSVAAGTQGPPGPIANLRGKVDANNALLVTVAGGTVSPDTILVGDGACGTTPSIAFTAQTTTGIYRPSTGTIGFCGNGTAGPSINGSQVNVPAGGQFRSNANGTKIQFPADGVVTLLDNAGTSFDRLQFGGTTSSFPSMKRSGTNISFRLADDSANTGVGASTIGINVSSPGNSQLGFNAVLFASLGTPANGTIGYCSDCTIASPCASGGTGALAKRLNSIWVCN